MAAAYDIAAIPEPYQILGLKLKPFSIGHYRILRRFDCAFVADEETFPTRDDLILAVLVCSMDADDFLRFMEQPDFLKQVKAWGKKVGLFDMNEKCVMLAKYIAAHSVMPKFWDGDQSRPSAGDWTQAVALCLTSQLGYTHEQAMRLPLSQAFHDYFKHAESNGAVRLMTPEEVQMCELAKQEAQSNGGA